MSKHIVHIIEVKNVYEVSVEAEDGNEAKARALSIYRKQREQLRKLGSPDHIIVVRSKGEPNLKEVDDVYLEAFQDPNGGRMEM